MDNTLKHIQAQVYKPCGFELSGLKTESESKEYDACRFVLNGLKIISRSAKITPKKGGQFVTFWKRKGNEPIEPFHETDAVDFYVVNLRADDKLGQFVFPRSVLIKKGIISTDKKEGKRAFRVYPPWDTTNSKQAERTQKWQLDYFYEIGENIDFVKVKLLYKNDNG
ncbi:MepB family protein [Fulvivirga sp.]|uniref:MepB family protein n=1 Tax=Fulvivirga sp. TaxID=1931237 RepID=UPI0032EAF45B